MAIAQDKSVRIKTGQSLVHRCAKGREVGDAFVNFHPCCRIVAATQAPWRRVAVSRHLAEQRVDSVGGEPALRRVDAVIDVDRLHLFRHGIGQRFQVQRCAIDGAKMEGLGVRTFDLRYG